MTFTVHDLSQKMVDKYVSISTGETGALTVQKETCIQVNCEA